MKILWCANTPWTPTGYGNQTDLFAPRLKAAGHNIVLNTTYGLQGSPRQFKDLLIMPQGRDAYGNDILAADAEHFGADIVITLMDVWVLQQAITGKFRWCPWLPVDRKPIPPRVADALGTAWQPIAYSRFGQREMEAVGLKPLYAPHGVDTTLFKPTPREEARARFNIPDDVFLVGMVAANKDYPSRKSFDENIRAFATLYRKHKDARMYIHTDFDCPTGEKIRRIVDLAGLPQHIIFQPDQYEYARGLLDGAYMRDMYSAMDVLTNATRGEGFGIPIIEAQACGTPVIVTDWTAMSELVGPGWKVRVEADDLFYSMESYLAKPPVGGIYRAMQAAYDMADDARQKQRQRARAFAALYDADRVMIMYWQSVLDEIAQRIAQENGRRKAIVVPAFKPEAVADAA